MLIATNKAESRLNALQATLAKAIVGARTARDVRGSLAVAECGWPLRLGTLMIERASRSLACIKLRPLEHPTRRIARIALDLPGASWAHAVVNAMRDPCLSQVVPDVWSSGIAPQELMQQACHEVSLRRNAVRADKQKVVRPLLVEIVIAAYKKDAVKPVAGLRCRFDQLHHSHHNLMKRLLSSTYNGGM